MIDWCTWERSISPRSLWANCMNGPDWKCLEILFYFIIIVNGFYSLVWRKLKVKTPRKCEEEWTKSLLTTSSSGLSINCLGVGNFDTWNRSDNVRTPVYERTVWFACSRDSNIKKTRQIQMINSPIYLLGTESSLGCSVKLLAQILNDNIKSKSPSPKILSIYFSSRVTNLTGMELDQGNHPILV